MKTAHVNAGGTADSFPQLPDQKKMQRYIQNNFRKDQSSKSPTLAEITAWANDHLINTITNENGEQNKDRAYVIGYEIRTTDPANLGYTVVISSKRLLANALKGKVMCADGTYKV